MSLGAWLCTSEVYAVVVVVVVVVCVYLADLLVVVKHHFGNGGVIGARQEMIEGQVDQLRRVHSHAQACLNGARAVWLSTCPCIPQFTLQFSLAYKHVCMWLHAWSPESRTGCF